MRLPAASVPRCPPFRVVGLSLLALVAVQSGCTSALSTTLLRDMPWDGVDHATETEPPEKSDHDAAESIATTAGSESTPSAAESAAARTAAVEEAMKRLSAIAALDAATEAALVDILRDAPQEDWPVVIEEFTAALAANAAAPAPSVAATPTPPEPAAVTPADHMTPEAAPVAVESAVVTTPPAIEPVPAVEPVPATEPVPAAEPAPAASLAAAVPAPPVVAAEPSLPEPPPAAELAIRNACFASRVRGWGDVDRFADARFRPGQELIVYFELDNLAATESAAGHTTRIDTSLRLVDDAGGVVHAWSFAPIAETCASQRRDYFARYVVRIPESVGPAAFRVELAVTDACGRVTATASLPCEVAGD